MIVQLSSKDMTNTLFYVLSKPATSTFFLLHMVVFFHFSLQHSLRRQALGKDKEETGVIVFQKKEGWLIFKFYAVHAQLHTIYIETKFAQDKSGKKPAQHQWATINVSSQGNNSCDFCMKNFSNKPTLHCESTYLG